MKLHLKQAEIIYLAFFPRKIALIFCLVVYCLLNVINTDFKKTNSVQYILLVKHT